MNIALVFHGCNKRGGVERSVWELAHALSQKHEVTVYARDIDAKGLEDVTVVRVPTILSGALGTAEFAWRVRRSMRPDHDHVVSFGVGRVNADVLWVNSLHRVWIRESQKYASEDWRSSRLRLMLPRHWIRLLMEYRYFKRREIVCVVVVADRVGVDLQNYYHVRPQMMRTIHNGFDPHEFNPARRNRERRGAREDLGLTPDDVALLMVANELPRKGFGVLLDAVTLVDDRRLHVVLAGKSSLEPYRPQILRSGLSDRVHYVGSSTDVGRLHAAADLFVLPTRYEAFCLAIVESLASGLPVITTAVAGAGDLIRPHENGLLMQRPTDAEELAELLRTVMIKRTRESWSEGATWSVSGLTWAQIAAETDALLETLSA